MRLVILSDTHELHRQITPPAADLLLHAGDWSRMSRSKPAIRDFGTWIAEQRLPFGAVAVPGNHEYYLEADWTQTALTPALTILHGKEITVGGLRIWGSGVTPSYGGAFGLSSARDRVRHWAQIPAGIDILITHGPPAGILDGGHGDPELLDAVQRVRPKLHLFGHAHGSYGVEVRDGITFANAALLGMDGTLEHEPMRIDLG